VYRKTAYYILLLLLLFTRPLSAQQENRTETGMSLSFAAGRDLHRNLNINFEEEVRLITGSNGFDRTVCTLGLDYSLFDRRIKIGACYAFIYLYNDDHIYESRHRFFLNLTFRQNQEPFTFSWRIRLQETLRDNSRGRYRINPRCVMKNKLEIEYAIWGKPWKPFLSCDFSTNLNDPETRYDLIRLRFQGGVNWRLDRTASIDFFVRRDEYLKNRDPHVVSLGVAYRLRIL
jgi:hypothetical protein